MVNLYPVVLVEPELTDDDLSWIAAMLAPIGRVPERGRRPERGVGLIARGAVDTSWITMEKIR